MNCLDNNFRKVVDSNDIICDYNQFIKENKVCLNEYLVGLLKEKNLIVSSAESFTGGSIASAIVNVNGASNVFYEGLVTYNVNAKINRLNVSKQTVEKNTVVSSEVCCEMAYGLLNGGNCDLSVATTGYASPTNDEKTNGLCYLAVATKSKIVCGRFVFEGSRKQIIEHGKDLALFMLINATKQYLKSEEK